MASSKTDEVEQGAKKESGAGFLVAMVLGTFLALGSGWFVGTLMMPSKTSVQKPAMEQKETNEKGDSESEESNPVAASENVATLEPIIVILRNSENTFLRLELAIVMHDDAPTLSTEDKFLLKSELSAYSRTLSLRQISGPSGYLHFRDDLLDRVRLISETGVKDVLVLSMVAE